MSSIQLPTLPSMSAVDTVSPRPAAGCSEHTNRMYSIKKKSFGFWDLLCLDPRAETQGEVLNIKGLRKTRGRRVSCGWDEGRGGAISLWVFFLERWRRHRWTAVELIAEPSPSWVPHEYTCFKIPCWFFLALLTQKTAWRTTEAACQGQVLSKSIILFFFLNDDADW